MKTRWYGKLEVVEPQRAVRASRLPDRRNRHLIPIPRIESLLRYLERQQVITIDGNAGVLVVSHELLERDPTLAQLSNSAVSGLAREALVAP